MTINATERNIPYNSRLAQSRVKWLIEHSTSHQLLWCIDSFVLRNPPLRQAANRSTRFATLILSNGSGQSGVRSANRRRTRAKQNNGVTSLSPDPLCKIVKRQTNRQL